MTLFYILLFTYFLKMLLFYRTVETKISLNAIMPASLFYFILMYTTMVYGRFGQEAFLILYGIISLMLLIDSVYYAHFKKLTSVFLLKKVDLLGVAGDSLPLMLHPYHFLFLLDLPLWFMYRNSLPTLHIIYEIPIRVILIFAVLWTLFVLFNPIKYNGFKRLKAQEFFTYHFSDIGIKLAKMLNIYKIDQADVFRRFTGTPASPAIQYQAMGAGRNLIVIQMESLQNFIIGKKYKGQEITPNLNRLLQKDSFYFKNYYQQIAQGNTSDAEFITQNSLYPTAYGQTYSMYEKNKFNGLPWILREKGYETMAFHGFHKGFWNRQNAYPAQGFQHFIGLEDFELTEKIGIGLSDEAFFEQALPHLPKDRPFYGFFVTLTNHLPYDLPKEKAKISLFPHHKNTLFGKYLNTAHYTDQAIGQFIENLKKEGLYDNSIIALYGDHGGLVPGPEVNKEMSEFLGYEYYFDTLMNIPLIIHLPHSGVHKTIGTTAGQIDFMPTILNLMGIEKTKAPFFGQDILNNTTGFVPTQLYLNKGSFIKDGVCFELSRDGIFENSHAWEIDSRIPVSIENYREDYERALSDIDISNYITDMNLIH